MHIRFRNILDDHWDIIIPSSNRLIIRSSNKPPILIHPSDRINRSKMLIVFLSDLSGIKIVLYDLFVGHSGEEDVLFGWVRVEFHNVGDFPIRECLKALSWEGGERRVGIALVHTSADEKTPQKKNPLASLNSHSPVSVSHNLTCRS